MTLPIGSCWKHYLPWNASRVVRVRAVEASHVLVEDLGLRTTYGDFGREWMPRGIFREEVVMEPLNLLAFGLVHVEGRGVLATCPACRLEFWFNHGTHILNLKREDVLDRDSGSLCPRCPSCLATSARNPAS